METKQAISSWSVDATHSEITFKVKHLMITNVKGEFGKFSVDVKAGEDFTNAIIHVVIDAASINTNSKDRDNHLRSADFFDVTVYPEITFKSTSMIKDHNENYKLTGMLAMKGISREVSLNAEYGGVTVDPWGNTKAGFAVNGKINRKDWNLNWNTALEAGGVMVGEEVNIYCELEFAKQLE